MQANETHDLPGVLLEAVVVPLWIFDIDHARVYWANAPALTLWNAESLTELCDRDMSSDMSPSVKERLKQYQEDCAQGQVFNELWTLYPKGEPRTYRCHFSGALIDGGRMGLFCQATGEAQSRDPDTLRSTQALLLTSTMVSLYDASGELIYANPAARKMLGSQSVLLSQHFEHHQHYEGMLAAIRKEGVYRGEAPVNTVNGVTWHELTVQLGPDAVSGDNAYLVSESDVTASRAAQERAHRLAYFDVLTQLPNRAYLVEQIEQELKSARRYRNTVALCFMDVDRFKTINDTLGHPVGDALLVQVAKAIESATYETDIVGRLGGDEFVCILRELPNAKAAAITAKRILANFSKPFRVDEHELFVTPSIGISVFPDDAETPGELMKHADIAMYQAKSVGGNAFTYFDAEMNQQAQARLALEGEIRGAARRKEFVLHYQPKVDIGSGVIVGVEALLRWVHPVRGVLGPQHFISVAEETGMLVEIGEWVLRESARQQVEWESLGYPLKIAVNISAKQFLSGTLCNDIRQALAQAGCSARNLELEITESVFMGSEKDVLSQLTEISAMGVSLAVDDFGTGYSNLAYLQNFPIDCLKIDQSFVRELDKPAILELIISLGKILKVKLVAEGVETQEQLNWLRDRGCDEFQGYYYSKPVDATALIKLIDSERDTC